MLGSFDRAVLTDSKPICMRCLLLEIDPEGLYKKVSELIEAMPEDVKTNADEYSRRLDICRRCECLENGICRECGCFVELRAAAKKNYCPNAYHYWTASE